MSLAPLHNAPGIAGTVPGAEIRETILLPVSRVVAGKSTSHFPPRPFARKGKRREAPRISASVPVTKEAGSGDGVGNPE